MTLEIAWTKGAEKGCDRIIKHLCGIGHKKELP